MFQSLRIAAAVVAVLSAPAIGADIARMAPPLPPIQQSPPPVWVWTGFYGGANVGYGWENAGSPTFSGSSPLIPVLQGMATDGLRYEGQGALGGIQIGYNHLVWPRVVVGVETDIQLAGIRRSGQATNVLGTGMAGDFSRSTDWLGTLRLRAGFLATERLLVYATGGLAYGGARFAANATDALGQTISVSRSETRFGYTLGAGTEVLLTRTISVKAEYLFYDLGKVRATAADVIPGTPATATGEIRVNGHLLRTGINYRF